MKIGIVGWGLEAQSAYRHFGDSHEYLIVNESAKNDFPPESERIKVQFLKNEAPPGISGQVGDLSYLAGIDSCDRVIYQPTAYFNLKKTFGDSSDFWDKATTAYDIFFEECQSKNIIGITGTKGKGTTSALIAKMLEANGRVVHLGGNIGTPILDLLPGIKASDWVVWELANFQLKPGMHSPHIALCLMITQEHLDWHPDMADYLEAKSNIFRYQSDEDIAIYYAKDENSKKLADYSKGVKIPYYQKPGAYVREDGMIVIGENEQEVLPKTEVKLLGEHNLQNVCAALTAVFEAIGSVDKAKTVLHSFKGLEHRLELVRSLGGIKYYDDSFATTPEAAIVAIKAVNEPKILVLGGFDKGLNPSKLIEQVVRSNVKQAILIGDTAPALEKMLKEKGFTDVTTGLADMPSIVKAAREKAEAGDAVLLSTGYASFGMFKDYKDRGEQFKSAVNSLRL